MRDKFLPLALPLSGVVCRLSPGHTTKGCGGKATGRILKTSRKLLLGVVSVQWSCLLQSPGWSSKPLESAG
jgi:hypothetical protein